MSSGKQWSGLLSAYYIPRWKAYFKALEVAVLTETKFDKDQFRYLANYTAFFMLELNLGAFASHISSLNI